MEIKKIKNLKFQSEILDIVQLTQNVKHFKISVPKDIEFTFTPGQYISIIMDDKSKNLRLRRPYSIVSSVKDTKKGYVELCIKILENGNITPILDKLKIKDKIECLKPLGDFKISEESKNKNIIFISTGVGIAPFKSMISELLNHNFKNKITLLTGYKMEEDKLYDQEFNELKKQHNNFKYYSVLSESENGRAGRVQSILEKHFDKKADYYICGVKNMISSVRLLLLKKGILGKDIYSEKYD
ncbi:MAG: FAD-binding oxidoreductase [Nanoarchaeota archaeon]